MLLFHDVHSSINGRVPSGFVTAAPLKLLHRNRCFDCISMRPFLSQRAYSLRCHIVQTPTAPRNILVVGAGVIGLTTAIRLRETGHNVTVLAQETPYTILDRSRTPWASEPLGTYTSAGSGGFWMPFLLEGTDIEEWATSTYRTLRAHVADDVGVSAMDALYLHAREEPVLPWYAELTNMVVVTSKEDKRVPKEYKCARKFDTLVVNMNRYLPHLQRWLTELDVPFMLTREYTNPAQSSLWDMEQVTEFAKGIAHDTIIVNCAGIGARFLADEDMIPGRGVILRVKRPPEVNYVITEDIVDSFQSGDGLLAYAIPRGDELSLGGTNFEGDWRENAGDEDVEAVRYRAEQLLPIRGMPETGRWSGLRPIRLDRQARVARESEREISNYGHGGSGVTLCWGCAEKVVQLVAQMHQTAE